MLVELGTDQAMSNHPVFEQPLPALGVDDGARGNACNILLLGMPHSCETSGPVAIICLNVKLSLVTHVHKLWPMGIPSSMPPSGCSEWTEEGPLTQS